MNGPNLDMFIHSHGYLVLCLDYDYLAAYCVLVIWAMILKTFCLHLLKGF